jgi:hypothetical protein
MPKYKPQNIPQNGAQKKAEDMTTKKTRGCDHKKNTKYKNTTTKKSRGCDHKRKHKIQKHTTKRSTKKSRGYCLKMPKCKPDKTRNTKI